MAEETKRAILLELHLDTGTVVETWVEEWTYIKKGDEITLNWTAVGGTMVLRRIAPERIVAIVEKKFLPLDVFKPNQS